MSRLRMMAPLVALAIIGGTAQASPRECEGLDASAVIDFRGASDGYRLRRVGRDIPVERFMDLLDYDRIEVVRPDGEISLQLPDRRLKRLHASDKPQCIRRAATGLLPNVYHRLRELLSRSSQLSWVGIGRGQAERGPLRLELADLAGGTAVVAAGERRMAVAWRGGNPPFSVTVTGSNGARLVDERGYRRLMRLKPRRIAPGRYEVVVRDSAGTAAKGVFTAVADPSARPLVEGDPDSAVAAAAELYASGPQRSFDAFMLLSPYYDEREANTPGLMMEIIAATSSRLPE